MVHLLLNVFSLDGLAVSVLNGIVLSLRVFYSVFGFSAC